MHITVKSEHAKMRLDKFLKIHFPELSRARLQRLVEAGQIKINNKTVAPHHFLRAGDEIGATIETPPELQVVPNPAVKFEVVHAEKDFIMINKPSGLVVHQSETHKQPDTLINGLLDRFPEIAKIGEDPLRPGLVHRLDAGVSGVMIVARTQDMFDNLKRQFKIHGIQKEYAALVHGKISPPSGTIEFTIGRKGAKMVARPKGAGGRQAVTEYNTISLSSFRAERSGVEESHTLLHGRRVASREERSLAGARDDKYSLLRIRTQTGRTHQIRVHLFAKGNPIVGDRLYGRGLRAKSIGQSKDPYALSHMPYASRLMLHARKLGFHDLQGRWREFIVETDWNNLEAKS